jgi:hypothetical protein
MPAAHGTLRGPTTEQRLGDVVLLEASRGEALRGLQPCNAALLVMQLAANVASATHYKG